MAIKFDLAGNIQIDNSIDSSEKGTANGVAPLDANAKLLEANLPDNIPVNSILLKQGVSSEIAANPPASNEIVYNTETSRMQVGTVPYAKLSETGVIPSLKIDYTGTLYRSFTLIPRAYIINVNSAGVKIPHNAVVIEQFSSSEYSEYTGIASGLTSLSFPDLAGVNGAFFGSMNLPLLTFISCPQLVFIKGSFLTASIPSLTSINFPLLESLGSNNPFDLIIFPSLAIFNLPSLKYVASSIYGLLSSCTTFSLPQLEYVNNFINLALASISSLSFPSLKYVGGAITLACANLVDFSFGTNLKSISGNISITGAKLNQASIDNILATLAALDGTNGTVSYGTGKTINLSGGTSSTPSSVGLAAKTVLQARGVTVTNN